MEFLLLARGSSIIFNLRFCLGVIKIIKNQLQGTLNSINNNGWSSCDESQFKEKSK